MAYIGQSINTGEVQYSTGSREPLPAGVYAAIVVRAQMKETKKKDGIYVEVEFDITGPQQVGRKFWDNFNIQNPSADATRIGLEQLGKLAKAAGIPLLEDDQQLLNKEVQIEIFIGKDGNGTPRNRVSGYYPAGIDVKAFKEQLKGGTAPTTPPDAAGPAHATPGPRPAPMTGAPSWRKPAA